MAASPDQQSYAPGSRVRVRGEEWAVEKSLPVPTGGYAVHVEGLTELVRHTKAIFLTELDDIEPLDPVRPVAVCCDEPLVRRDILDALRDSRPALLAGRVRPVQARCLRRRRDSILGHGASEASTTPKCSTSSAFSTRRLIPPPERVYAVSFAPGTRSHRGTNRAEASWTIRLGTTDHLRLATMHRVKGLEFPTMFVAGVGQGFVPLATPELDSDDRVVAAQELKRERCLFYVATTRARDRLFVTAHGTPSSLLGF